MTPDEAKTIGEAYQEIENTLSSVKLIRNSKGYNWEVKIYDENPEIAANTAIEIEEKLQKKYGGI